MMRKLVGCLGAGAILWVFVGLGGGCTPTEREFNAAGGGGQGGCGGSLAECDGNLETVCETDTSASNLHCGACDQACTAVADAEHGCVAGKCSITSCTNGRENCDNFYENGCETNPMTNSDHCGTCGNSCAAPDAITACVAGTCLLAQCVMGKLDCDMDAKTGCEVDPATNVDHCGACGAACFGAFATMACVNSQCMIGSCDPNYIDCDQIPENGCERDSLTDHAHCGTCGNDCGTGGCRNGTCVLPELLGPTPFPPGKLAIYKMSLYIGSRSTAGDVGSMPLTGGPANIIGTGPGMINALYVDLDGIYMAGSQGAMRLSFDGTSKFNYSAGFNQLARGIAVVPGRVYWTALSNIRYSDINLPLPMTFATTLAASQGIMADAANNILYWTLNDGSVWSSPVGTMAMSKQLAMGPNGANNIVADDKYLYWSSTKGIERVDILGGDPVEIGLSPDIRSVAIDATHVYWTDENAGMIQRVRKDGSGLVEIIGFSQQGPYGLALDNQYVYWSNSTSSNIWRAPK